MKCSECKCEGYCIAAGCNPNTCDKYEYITSPPNFVLEEDDYISMINFILPNEIEDNNYDLDTKTPAPTD